MKLEERLMDYNTIYGVLATLEDGVTRCAWQMLLGSPVKNLSQIPMLLRVKYITTALEWAAENKQ